MFSVKFFTLAAAAAAVSFVDFAAAVPTPDWPGRHGTPTNIAFGVQICSGENGVGDCRTSLFTIGACQFVPSDFTSQTSSFVVADPRANCVLFRDHYCNSWLENVEGPFGDPTMDDNGTGKQMNSYMCNIDAMPTGVPHWPPAHPTPSPAYVSPSPSPVYYSPSPSPSPVYYSPSPSPSPVYYSPSPSPSPVYYSPSPSPSPVYYASPSPSPSPASSGSAGTVPLWGMCGGIGFTGSTRCASGSTCTYSNPYYSQCLA